MPVAMEQPTNIVTRPLSMDDPDDRIRMVFGLTSDDRLPKADTQTQQQFFDHLKVHLSFPFKADYWPASAIGPSKSGTVVVLGFADRPLGREEGVVCEARRGKHEFQVPLCGLQVKEDDPNHQQVEDYTYWLWRLRSMRKKTMPWSRLNLPLARSSTTAPTIRQPRRS